MGFTPEQAKFGLKKRSNKVQQAIEYILSHPMEESSSAPSASTEVHVNESFVGDITAMGFSREAAIQALIIHNNSLEQALNFLLSG